MSQRFTPKVITANRLREGDAVWLTANDHWSTRMSEAELMHDEARAQKRLQDAERMHDMIVGAYLADAASGENGPEPVHYREAFRTRGPGNYAHGKQSDAA